MSKDAGLDLSFLSDATELDRLLEDARAFVREHKGKGNLIDATILLAVLLQDQDVKDFVASRTGRSAHTMERVAQAAEQNASDFIKNVNSFNAPETFRFIENDGSGIPDVRTITRERVPSEKPSDEIGMHPVWANEFRKFEVQNAEALKTRAEILVALTVDMGTGFETTFNTEKALGDSGLNDFQKGILQEEYSKDFWPSILYSTPRFDAPTGKALALVRRWQAGTESPAPAAEQKPEKTGFFAACAMDRAAAPAVQAEPARNEDPGNNGITIAHIAAALQDPKTVDALFANPEAREALMAGITRALARVPAPSPTLDASGQEAKEAGNRQPPGGAPPPPANAL